MLSATLHSNKEFPLLILFLYFQSASLPPVDHHLGFSLNGFFFCYSDPFFATVMHLSIFVEYALSLKFSFHGAIELCLLKQPYTKSTMFEFIFQLVVLL